MVSAVDGNDGLDESIWQTICEAVSAVSRGDPAAAQAATDRFAIRVPFDSQPTLYLWWLLRYRVANVLGRRPTADDLHEISQTARSEVLRIVRDPRYVENTLLTVWKLASAEQEMESGRLLVGSVVALGVLLGDPDEDLEGARPHLAEWWRRNLEKVTADGFLDDRATPEARLTARWPKQ